MRRRAGGFTVIELIVGVIISLLGMIVIFQVYQNAEQQKRTATGQNDASQQSAYAAYYLQYIIQMAGNGILSAPHACGCTMSMTSNGSSTGLNIFSSTGLASSGVWPASPPASQLFTALQSASVPAPMKFSPVYIIPGLTSYPGGSQVPGTPDTIIVLGGNSISSAAPTSGVQTNSGQNFEMNYIANAGTEYGGNNLGYSANDAIIGFGPNTGGACPISVASTVPATTAGAMTMADTNFNGTSAVNFVDIGNAGSLIFKAYGVSTDPDIGSFTGSPNVSTGNNYLVSYNLVDGSQSPISENVVNMKFLYVINNAGVISTVTPTGNYAPVTLSANPATISTIMGVRMEIVTQNGQPTKTVQTTAINFFPDLSLPAATFTWNLTGIQRYYRYKITDVTVPIRNMQINSGICQ